MGLEPTTIIAFKANALQTELYNKAAQLVGYYLISFDKDSD